MGGTVIDRLVSVKSIVTLTLTGVFSYLAIVGKVDGKEFLTIFTVVIGFYFGTEARINGLTYADGTPISVGYYEFDENGKMIILWNIF